MNKTVKPHKNTISLELYKNIISEFNRLSIHRLLDGFDDTKAKLLLDDLKAYQPKIKNVIRPHYYKPRWTNW